MSIQLSKLETTQVSRIACSERHCLAVTNTGSVFAWGENEYSQLGYTTSKKPQGIEFEPKPRKIESLAKQFVIDAACGDNHSLVLTNQREVLAWGLNKQCQLGFDRQSYPVVHAPKKIRLLEYMNSSNIE